MAGRLGVLFTVLLSTTRCAAEPPVVYVIDPARSELVVQLFKAGVGSALAHDHVVRATDYRGRIRGTPAVPSTATVVVDVQSAALRADEPAVRRKYGLPALPSDADRNEIQRTMESASQLDVAHHPTMHLVSTRIEQRAETEFVVTAELTIRDVTRQVTFPVVVERSDRIMHGRGSLRFTQSGFGYQPYSAFFGAVRNQDEVVLHFDIVATQPP